MDPDAGLETSHHIWLPRKRGDGPHEQSDTTEHRAAPPQTRGWTRSTCNPPAFSIGSPANAGMDPELVAPSHSGGWLPRKRGDGPMSREAFPTLSQAPPQTRGWTLAGQAGWNFTLGSPANAGMDPRILDKSAKRLGLPRKRGDGPAPKRAKKSQGSAPPQTRGWTRCRNAYEAFPHGSPANAGMDPRGRPPGLLRNRLPRKRGDGPRREANLLREPPAPPQTRGWTQLSGGAVSFL